MSKKTLSVFVLIALCVSLTVFIVMSDSPNAQNEDMPQGGETTLSLVVLDVQGILNNSDASESIKEQARILGEDYQEELAGLENKLRKSQEKILKETKDSPTEEKVKARKGFEKELVEANKQAQEKRKALEEAVNNATQELRQKILEIVAKMATEEGYDLVLSRQDVVIVGQKYDITDQVMERLNSELQEIELEVK